MTDANYMNEDLRKGEGDRESSTHTKHKMIKKVYRRRIKHRTSKRKRKRSTKITINFRTKHSNVLCFICESFINNLLLYFLKKDDST